MRARYVFEAIKFTRGTDPKKSMAIGRWAQIEEEFNKDWYREYSPDEALKWACTKGLTEIAEFLLMHQADPNYEDGTPLGNAMESGHNEIAKMIMDSGRMKKKSLTNVLENARNLPLEAVKMLINAGAKATDEVLDAFIWRGNPDTVQYLFSKGAKIKNHKSTQGSLSYKVTAEMLKVFLKNGLKLDNKDNKILKSAARNGDPEAVRILLDNGFSGSGTIGGETLISAAGDGSPGNLEVVKILIDAGADLNITGEDRTYYVERYSALTKAAEMGRTEIVRTLLDAGADIHILNDKAHKVARKNRRTETLELIKDYKKQARVRARELAKQNN